MQHTTRSLAIWFQTVRFVFECRPRWRAKSETSRLASFSEESNIDSSSINCNTHSCFSLVNLFFHLPWFRLFAELLIVHVPCATATLRKLLQYLSDPNHHRSVVAVAAGTNAAEEWRRGQEDRSKSKEQS
eukprot:752805-Hanusia_phi.AAC.1